MFETRPVTNEKNLYGKKHKEALKQLKKNVEEKTFTAILGPRRVGKTSIIRVFLNKYRYRYIYYDLSPFMSKPGISYTELTPAMMNIETNELSYHAQLSLGLVRLDVKPENGVQFQNALINLLRELNGKYDNLLVIIDEAQVMPRIRGVNMLGLLQLISNTMDNITVIMTGSMPGLLEKILSPSASQPMFARYVDRIHIPRWTREESMGYLKKGLHKAKVSCTRAEVEEAAEELSNVPGFLAYYGKQRTRGMNHSEALVEASNYAINIWEQDLEAFLNIYSTRAYVTTLWALAQSKFGLTRKEIAGEVLHREKISDRSLSRILRNLVSSGMVEHSKERRKYIIAENPLAKAVQNIARKYNIY
ncbi:ATP-binding protein [Thermococcus argininiproducens]|uniref:ATP-binding protein n=1 Tax=Thermococcus argininiproducens TaxID=2866384 RepID=A0A9E7MBH9_9EURY|nr:ATP-binding protein [Thermococcus argininiproducens]USH00438.1 ATP-binding protein [Thermococcus argininiproducens]